jgi:S-DNA-T family DNA segregation ATPase FtsK/SpoIIIE
MRGLFTQTVALRLRSAEETVMVLGDGMSKIAPAHRISPTHPGTAWVVEDTGAADRVRADYWPDSLIRGQSRRYATEVHGDIRPDHGGSEPEVTPAPSEERVRTPRATRKPRTPRQPRQAAVGDVPEDGAA